MVFPNYNYQEFNNENKSEWPIQPSTIGAWCKMVNLSIKYCRELPLDRIDEFIGICREPDLPSFHKYWTREVTRGIEK